MIDVGLLEFCVREDLNKKALRRMVVLDPLKVIITNFPEDISEICHSENNPEDIAAGMREIAFTREIFIEKEDFMETPSKKYFRLAPGKMVRLKGAYIIQCDDFVKDENGEIKEVRCSFIENSKSGQDATGINVKGTLHWVSAKHAVPTEIRLYDRLFSVEDPTSGEGDFKDYMNPNSLNVITGYAEPALKEALTGESFQFLRKGYFALDQDSAAEKLVFNRTVTLRDNWAKAGEK